MNYCQFDEHPIYDPRSSDKLNGKVTNDLAPGKMRDIYTTSHSPGHPFAVSNT